MDVPLGLEGFLEEHVAGAAKKGGSCVGNRAVVWGGGNEICFSFQPQNRSKHMVSLTGPDIWVCHLLVFETLCVGCLSWF